MRQRVGRLLGVVDDVVERRGQRVAVGRAERHARLARHACSRWMMSWAMRSPSCSQIEDVARQLRALGVVREQVAQQHGASAGRCGRPPRGGPGAGGRRTGCSDSAIACDPSRAARRAAGSFTVRSQPVHGRVTGSAARGPVGCAAMEAAIVTPTRSSASASSRSARATGSSWPAGRALTAVGARVRRCSSRWRAAPGRHRAPRGPVRAGLGRRRCARGDRSIDVYVHKLRVKLEDALPRLALHPHARRLRLPLRAGAFTRFSHPGHGSVTDCGVPSAGSLPLEPSDEIQRSHFVKRNTIIALCLAGALALGVAACGDDEQRAAAAAAAAPRRTSRARSRIDGSSTVFPFAEAAAELFNEEQPDVKVTVGAVRHRRRLREVLRRRDRHLRRLAADQGGRGGPRLREERRHLRRGPDRQRRHRRRDEQGPRGRLPDHRRSSRSCGTRARRSSRSARSTPKLPDTQLSLYGPGTDSGTFDFFTDEINGEEGVTREDYEASEDDNQLVTGVAGDEGGLGYFGFSYSEQNQDKLNLVGVDAGDGCVKPSKETIQDGTYKPLSRPLFMYPSAKSMARPEVKAFMDFVLANQAGDRRRREDRPADRRAGPEGPDGARQGREPGRGLAMAESLTMRAAGRRSLRPDPVGPVPRGGRHPWRPLRRRAAVRGHDARHHRLAARRDRRASSATSAGRRLPVRHEVDAAAARRPAVLRRPAARLGHGLPEPHRARGGRPARPAGRDLPRRVRADRACARSSSRCSRCWPACRRSSSATSRSPSSPPTSCATASASG